MIWLKYIHIIIYDSVRSESIESMLINLRCRDYLSCWGIGIEIVINYCIVYLTTIIEMKERIVMINIDLITILFLCYQ